MRARTLSSALLLVLLAGGARPASAQLRLFMPGGISTEAHDELTPAFSPDGRRMVFVRREPDGVFTLHESLHGPGGWGEPRPLLFSGRWNDQAPAFSADGATLFFQSRRPLDPARPRSRDAPRDDDLWRVELEGGEWGEPRRLGSPVRRSPPDTGGVAFQGREMSPAVTADGALYYWSVIPGRTAGESDLYVARTDGAGFLEPENVGRPPNSPHFETHPWPAPDGSYLLFSCDGCPDTLGGSDVYLTRRRASGWSAPVNLGPTVNSEAYDFGALVSPDGRYLYVSSNRPRTPGGEASEQNIWRIPVEEVPALAFLWE